MSKSLNSLSIQEAEVRQESNQDLQESSSFITKEPTGILVPNKFMITALNQAKLAFDVDEVPVGAVVVKDGEIIAQDFNKNILLKDPTAHAEILAMRSAAQYLQSNRLDGCDLYVTLEPCAMCVSAISLSRIRRLYYAASDHKFGGIENGLLGQLHKCYHRPEIYSGFLEKESAELLKDFFRKKRHTKAKIY